jgi:phosphatidate cytidylyltransferase
MRQDALNHDMLRLLGSVYAVLFTSLCVGWYQVNIKHNAGVMNFYNRAKSWFVITLIVSVVFLLKDLGLMVFFGVLALVGLTELEFHKGGPRRRSTLLRFGVPTVLASWTVLEPMVATGFFVGLTLVLTALLFSPRFPVYYARLYAMNLIGCWFMACIYHLWVIFDAGTELTRYDVTKIVFYVMLTSQTHDILQYIMGKLYGRRLQFKIISPHKTREGYVYGIAASLVACPLLYGFLISPLDIRRAGALTLAVLVSGALGDLIFSAIKRSQGKKDFSGLIPHHGGLLDRFDSLILALPVSYYCLV